MSLFTKGLNLTKQIIRPLSTTPSVKNPRTYFGKGKDGELVRAQISGKPGEVPSIRYKTITDLNKNEKSLLLTKGAFDHSSRTRLEISPYVQKKAIVNLKSNLTYSTLLQKGSVTSKEIFFVDGFKHRLTVQESVNLNQDQSLSVTHAIAFEDYETEKAHETLSVINTETGFNEIERLLKEKGSQLELDMLALLKFLHGREESLQKDFQKNKNEGYNAFY